jgi:hypothetical protein
MRYVKVVLLVALFLMIGCGKSDEQKKAEEDLNSQIMKLHDYSMASMDKIEQLQTTIDSVIALTEAAGKARVDQTVVSGLRSGKSALENAASDMDKWMEEYRPYDQTRDHAAVMEELTKEKERLARATSNALAAIDSADAALKQYEAAAGKLSLKH